MLQRLRTLIQEAENLPHDAQVRQASIALIRITLQHVCISVAEWLIHNRNVSTDLQNNLVSLDLNRLHKPSDGTLVTLLSEFLFIAESEGWSGISRPYMQKTVPAYRPCTRLIKNSNPVPEQILRAFVELRNNGVEGHGIPGRYDREAEIDAVKILVERLEHILPQVDDATPSLALVCPNGEKFVLKLLKVENRNLICYRRIKPTINGRCIVDAQEQTALFDNREFSYEADYILGLPDYGSSPQYTMPPTYHDDWKPFALIPDRLTQYFTGRGREIEELRDWYDDVEARACMVYGDGGVGKTTLVVEFIHRVLEGRVRTQWQPEVITYYTAKQTRWTLDGLEIIRTTEVGVTDVAIEILKAFDDEDKINRGWYSKQPLEVINKLAGYLDSLGIKRNNHLLILDNTETMANSPEDIRALEDQIRELSRRVGRVLLTSRRQERIEARQIQIDVLSADESVNLLRKRAESLKCQPVLQAGTSTLRKYANRLGNKPLVLEVFLQAVNADDSLDSAFQRVQRMKNQDLGEFLYTDAWGRLTPRMQHLLLLMSRVSEIHDDNLLKLCCIEVDATIIEAEESLGASRGIASISTIQGYRQIKLNSDFLQFCRVRTVTINNKVLPTDDSVKRIARRHREFLQNSQSKIRDRLIRAYLHPYARAAKAAYDSGNFEDCNIYYELAILEDKKNGWLFDRFAYSLLQRNELDEALKRSQQAIQLEPKEGELWFTKGMIEARLGKTQDAINSLKRAEALGKPKHLCTLQKAYAYFNDNPPDKARGRSCLDESEKSVPENDPYRAKHVTEIRKNREKLAQGYDLKWAPKSVTGRAK